MPKAALGSVVPGSFDHSLRHKLTSLGIMQAYLRERKAGNITYTHIHIHIHIHVNQLL